MIGTSGIDQEVQAKMDAYRGNPNALAQKYSQNQQLIDLLALQKLKSEKEAAAREMQMKMGGQQMPTIAEARENEVLDLTKQELAQQSTGAMQQQQAQKQQAAKQLIEQTAQNPMQAPMQAPMTGGVASLPAPNIAPKAMAAGGIVAFDQGGGVSFDPLAGVSGLSPEAVERDRERLERIRQEEERRRAEREEYDRQRGLITTAPPVTTAQAQAQDIESGQSQTPTLTAPRTPAAVPTGTTPTGAPATGLASIDPRAIALRNEIAQYIGLTPEELAQRKQMQEERAALDAARFDPDRRRSKGLTRWLLGGAGRTGIGSILGGAGAAVENYDESMDQQERQALVDRQKQLESATLMDVGIRKSAFDLGLKSAIDYAQIAAKQAETAMARAGQNQAKYLAILNSTQGRYNDALREVNNVYTNAVKGLNI